jgi:gluconolactonase
MIKCHCGTMIAITLIAGTALAAQGGPPPAPQTPGGERRTASVNTAPRVDVREMPRPIDLHDSVWIENLTMLEVRDLIKSGKTTALIMTGGIEENGPYLTTGKHNNVLKAMGESIGRALGNALVAPIVTLEPGNPARPNLSPGTIVLSQATYRAVLTDIATSLKSQGFTDIVMMGDSGGNMTAMKEVAAALNAEWKQQGAIAYFIPEFYNYADVEKFEEDVLGIHEKMEGYHDDYYISSIIATVDTNGIRMPERVKAGKFVINGVPLAPIEKTIANGKRIVQFRTEAAVTAIKKAMAAAGRLASPIVIAQGGGPQPPPTDTATPAIPGVAAAGTKVVVIKSGFQGTEGPIGMPDGTLIFTETQANRITRIAADGSTSTFLENTNGSNGLAFDAKGRLISVQTTPGQTKIGVIHPKGAEAVLSDNFDGKGYGRPNDLVVSMRGGIYFTEPGPNVTPGAPPPATPPLPPAVYFIPPGGKAMKVADGIERPNGIMLSRDEKTLYVNNSNGEYLLAFDVKPDGTIGNRRNFAKYQGGSKNATGVFVSGADGLAIDNEGRVYTATAAGVEVYDEKGTHLGTIPLSRAPQNIAFAGPDKKTLYIVGRGSAFKVDLQTPGFKGRAK